MIHNKLFFINDEFVMLVGIKVLWHFGVMARNPTTTSFSNESTSLINHPEPWY